MDKHQYAVSFVYISCPPKSCHQGSVSNGQQPPKSHRGSFSLKMIQIYSYIYTSDISLLILLRLVWFQHRCGLNSAPTEKILHLPSPISFFFYLRCLSTLSPNLFTYFSTLIPISKFCEPLLRCQGRMTHAITYPSRQ